jgi:hypothetical protein
MTAAQSRRAHDIGDICERMIDLQLERLSWLEPKQSTRGGRASNKPRPVNNGN